MSVASVAVPPRTRLSQLSRASACWVKSGRVLQNRTAFRAPFAEPVVVTPWDESKAVASGRSLLASGRDISTSGLSFWHDESIPHRFVAVSYRGAERDDDGEWTVETILVRLLWCRFAQSGNYLSGGRYERAIGNEFGRPFAMLLGTNSSEHTGVSTVS